MDSSNFQMQPGDTLIEQLKSTFPKVPFGLLKSVEEAVSLNKPLEEETLPNGTISYKIGHLRFVENFFSNCKYCNLQRDTKRALNANARTSSSQLQLQHPPEVMNTVPVPVQPMVTDHILSEVVNNSCSHVQNPTEVSVAVNKNETDPSKNESKRDSTRLGKPQKKKKKHNSGERSAAEEKKQRNERREQRRLARRQSTVVHTESVSEPVVINNGSTQAGSSVPTSVRGLLDSLPEEDQELLSESEVITLYSDRSSALVGTGQVVEEDPPAPPPKTPIPPQKSPAPSDDSDLEIIFESIHPAMNRNISLPTPPVKNEIYRRE